MSMAISTRLSAEGGLNRLLLQIRGAAIEAASLGNTAAS
jgi:hypothetical protein